MIPRNWHHGHSLTAGAIAGALFVSYRVWLALALAFAAGVLLTLAVVNGRRLVSWTGRLLDRRLT